MPAFFPVLMTSLAAICGTGTPPQSAAPATPTSRSPSRQSSPSCSKAPPASRPGWTASASKSPPQRTSPPQARGWPPRGLATATEEDTACCYAVQDKARVTGPGGEPWEVYVVKADSGIPGDDAIPVPPARFAGPASMHSRLPGRRAVSPRHRRTRRLTRAGFLMAPGDRAAYPAALDSHRSTLYPLEISSVLLPGSRSAGRVPGSPAVLGDERGKGGA